MAQVVAPLHLEPGLNHFAQQLASGPLVCILTNYFAQLELATDNHLLFVGDKSRHGGAMRTMEERDSRGGSQVAPEEINFFQEGIFVNFC